MSLQCMHHLSLFKFLHTTCKVALLLLSSEGVPAGACLSVSGCNWGQMVCKPSSDVTLS